MHLDLRAELLDRRRHLIADAHDVADRQVRRRPDVDHLQRRVRGVVDVLPPDVRVLDHLIAAVERLPAGRHDRARRDTRRRGVRRRPDREADRLRFVRPRRTSAAAPAASRVQPCGSSSVHRRLRLAPVVSLTTVTRISRDAVARRWRRRRLAAARRRSAPAVRRARGAAGAGAARRAGRRAQRGRRNDRDLRRHAHRQRRHDQQLRSLLAAEDVALVAVLHRQAVDDFFAARRRSVSVTCT